MNLKNNTRMNYAILSTYVREDNDYLDEWVKYHLAIGFEHIVMYDHKSIVPVRNIWGDKVSVIRVERDSLFHPTYLTQDTLRSHPSCWLAAIDVDEYIVLFEDKDIKDLLKRYEAHGALGIPWSVYGSSGHLTQPAGGVKDSYVWRRPDEPMWVKPIINTQYCLGISDPHFGIYSRPSVNEAFEPFVGPICDSPRAFIKINHYFTKSLEEYKRKIARGTGNVNTPPRPIEWFDFINKNSTVYDDVLKDFGKPKIWENIFGWFNFHNFYTDMVGYFNDAVFVEIGCWEGRSAVFMADKIIKSGKNIKFYAIDIWADYEQEGVMWKARYEEFLKNIEPVKSHVNPIRCDSVEASKQFADKSVDFIFIDANHEYEAVKKDILAWMPKLKDGGIIAGHDYNTMGGVNKAVDELIKDFKLISNYWYYDTKGTLGYRGSRNL